MESNIQELRDRSIGFDKKLRSPIEPLIVKIKDKQKNFTNFISDVIETGGSRKFKTKINEILIFIFLEKIIKHQLIEEQLNRRIPGLGEKSRKECVSNLYYFPIIIDFIKEIETRDEKEGGYKPHYTYSE